MTTTAHGDRVDTIARALRTVRAAYIESVKRYHRLGVTVAAPLPDTPCLVVTNHGFGGMWDLNVYAALAALEVATGRPVSILTHQMAWTFGVGRFLEKVGAVPAHRESARQAFDRGDHVLVAPGGDWDAAKPWRRRNEIVFRGRTGFAQVALDAGVPIVPIVTAGAGESLFVFSDGARLAERLGLSRRLRVETLPVTLSIPWGLNVGLVAVMPYLPLPTKLDTVVLPAVEPARGESREHLAARVQGAMQATLTELTQNRVPLLGNRVLGNRAAGRSSDRDTRPSPPTRPSEADGRDTP